MKDLKFLLVIILFALFASIFSLQKMSLNYSEPFFLIGFRMIFAGLILLFYNFYRCFTIPSIKIEHIKFFIYLSIYHIYLTNIFEIWGLNNMSSAKACMIYSLSPFITAVIAFFILKESITKKKTIGMFFGFLGLIPMLFFKTYEEYNVDTFFIFSFSEISLILSVLFSVLGWVFLKKIIKLGYSFIFANSISMFFGGFFILIHSYLCGENWNPFPIFNIKYFFIYTLITCIISNVICYNLFGFLLTYFSTTFMTFSGLMTPFFASFFGWMFLNELITWHFFLSIFLFFIGFLIFYSEEKN